MSGEAWLYLFAVIINAVNLFLQVFFTIMYSDLEWYGTPDNHRLTWASISGHGGGRQGRPATRDMPALLRHGHAAAPFFSPRASC